MKEKKFTLSLAGAIIILSIAILFASTQISNAIRDTSNNSNETDYSYELNRFNENFEQLKEIIQNK